MPPVLIDARPDAVNLVFLRGTARNVPFQWPAGALAGRTFTATLGAQSLSVTIVADLLTVSITVAQTLAVPDGTTQDFTLTETTGDDQPIITGRWTASDKPNRVTPNTVLTVTQSTSTVSIQVIGGTNLPQIVSSDPAKVSVATVGGVTTLGVEKTVPEFARLTADSAAVNNSTALVDVTGLFVPVAINAVYIVDAVIFYTSTTVADFKFAWTVPAGVSGAWAGRNAAPNAPGLGADMHFNRNDWGNFRDMGGLGTPGICRPSGLLITGATAGNLQAQFAQVNLEATNTVVHAHSFIRAERVA